MADKEITKDKFLDEMMISLKIIDPDIWKHINEYFILKSKAVPVERIRKAIEELEGEIQQINNKISRTRHTQSVRDLLSKRIIPETKKEALNSLLKEV